MWIRTCVVLAGLLASVPPAFAGDGLGVGETITLSMDGANPADGQSYSSSISHDGRYVAFMSNATNLSSPAGDGLFHVLLRDRKSGTTRIVSVSGGVLANAACDSPALSGNGRYIAFRTAAPNFPSSNGKVQVYRHDRVTGETVLVSADGNGDPSEADCWSSSIDVSKNGRFIVFTTAANLLGGFGTGVTQAYRRDVKKGITALVSIATTGGFSDDGVYPPRISDDGRFVTFASASSNVADNSNLLVDVFLRDMKKGVTTLISTPPAGGAADDACFDPAISGNGRRLAFVSRATNLVAGDSGSDVHLFVFDRKTGDRKQFHVDVGGEKGSCEHTAISNNGTSVVVNVREENGPGPIDDVDHVFVASWKSGATTAVSVDSDEVESPCNFATAPSISGNGKFVGFESDSPALGADQDAKADVFLRRLK